ncbi:MAG: UDP-N-acetylglucosamine 2-epimerase (non-hydrolyzing) [Sedimentisphaerales bacterium]|nr:UDP-N-acetylglucosamine 2-epimerase (non-hydrolyzing) [Sedimentisphaerales bacterium]
MRIINVVGARPNFMKIAPLMEEYERHPEIEPLLVHTGQHYDEKMSTLFFKQLGIREPDVNLEVGSASHAVQTADIMTAFEPVLLDYHPDAVLVVGDVNSTIACGLVAAKLHVKVIHVEAGLRSFDRSMPEEINRVLTDSISDLLFCTEQSGVENLMAEGIDQDKIYLVGHVMIDTLKRNMTIARQSTILNELRARRCIDGHGYSVLTLHRPANVDDPLVFSRILDALEVIQNDLPIIFPIHPRTLKNITSLNLRNRIDRLARLHLIDPIGYLDFLKLQSSARVVFTDSGGIQEETTVLKVPCITLRENTERPVTVEMGTNQIVGTDTQKIVHAFKRIMEGNFRESRIPPLWDGKAAERIVDVIEEKIVDPKMRRYEVVEAL